MLARRILSRATVAQAVRCTTPSVFRPVQSVWGIGLPGSCAGFSGATTATIDPRLSAEPRSEHYNIPEDVVAKVGKNLHLREGHPLHIIKHTVEQYFKEEVGKGGGPAWKMFDDLSPVVTKEANFDQLLIPADHVSRQPSDTFYIDDEHLLRCHTSAHQTETMRSGEKAFLVAGDVYRRDAVDSSHYPVFHQMEGVRIYDHSELPADVSREDAVEFVVKDMKAALDGMVRKIFGDVEMRWIDEYFPFTDPSFELEIFFQGEWLEVLGCGMIHRDVMKNAELSQFSGYAFGLGLERLAMVLFDIPDIRLFWTDDDRFHSQFADGQVRKFKPYSKYPPCYKDMSFWLPEGFHEHDLYELVRSVAGDLVERVDLIDDFEHPVTARRSHCYRINYRSMDRSLTNAEIDELQEQVRERSVAQLKVELR